MKLLAYLVMTACLLLGTMSATTAYSPLLSLNDGAFVVGTDNGQNVYAHLNTTITKGSKTIDYGAGRLPEPEDDSTGEQDPHDPMPLFKAGTELTPGVLAALRDHGVGRVRVREFAISRWSHAWVMLASCLGLAVAAIVLKTHARREIAAKLAAPTEPTETPEHALAEIRATVDSVLEALPSLGTDHERNHMIIEQIGALQWTHLQAILDARPTLIARLRLGGFAHFMDRYSALERQLNRAWSAAADDVFAESETALRAAHALLPEVEAKLSGNSAQPST